MATWTTLGRPEHRSFAENLRADPEVAGRVDDGTLAAAMDPLMHLGALDRIFAAVFGE
jgi:adenylosuccinate lyase